jgi:predicted metalloendopeptidase
LLDEARQMTKKCMFALNIGVLAGMTISYNAYQMSLASKAAPVIDGLTGN